MANSNTWNRRELKSIAVATQPLITYILALVFIVMVCGGGILIKLANAGTNLISESETESAGIQFCHAGNIYKATTKMCPGGIVLKSSLQPLPSCICAHGVFFHEGFSGEANRDDIIRSKNYQCFEYNVESHSELSIFFPLTTASSPFNETLAIIPYAPNTNYLDYFLARRYKIDDIINLASAPIYKTATSTRQRMFFVGSDEYQISHMKPEQIRIGNICLHRTLPLINGIYIDDIEDSNFPTQSENSSFEHSDLGDVTKRAGRPTTCAPHTTKLQISDPHKVHSYSKFSKKECQISDSCIGIHETVPDRTDEIQPGGTDVNIEHDSYNDEDLHIARRTRDTKKADCNRVVEENVQLAEYTMRLNHRQILPYDNLENSSPFQVVHAAFSVYKTVISQTIVSHAFIDHIYTYFYYLYFDNHKGHNKYQQSVTFALHQCNLNSRPMVFVLDESCPAKVEFFKKPASQLEHELVQVNLSAGRKFDETKHDVIPETVYKIINFVYNHCHGYFDERRQQRHIFKVEMQKLLLTSAIQLRWRKRCSKITKLSQYRSILPHGDLNAVMDNLDATVAAALAQNDHPTANSNWIKRPLRASTSKNSSRRKKRNNDPERYEIWGGRAYCLQMID